MLLSFLPKGSISRFVLILLGSVGGLVLQTSETIIQLVQNFAKEWLQQTMAGKATFNSPGQHIHTS